MSPRRARRLAHPPTFQAGKRLQRLGQKVTAPVTPRSAPSPQGHGLRLALRRHLAPSGPGHGFPIPRAKSRVESKRTRPGVRPSPSPSSPRGSRAPSMSRPRLRELRELGKQGGLSSPAQTHLRGSVWPWTVFRQRLYHLKKKKAKPLLLGTGAHRTAPPPVRLPAASRWGRRAPLRRAFIKPHKPTSVVFRSNRSHEMSKRNSGIKQTPPPRRALERDGEGELPSAPVCNSPLTRGCPWGWHTQASEKKN